MKTKTPLMLMAILLLMAPAVAAPHLRLVSLLPDPVVVEVAGESHLLKPRQSTEFFSPHPGVISLLVTAQGRQLHETRFGISETARYTLVVFGSPDAPRPQDTWTALKQMFEGEGTTHKLGYSVQCAILRDNAYTEKGKCYLRFFHGATGLVSVKLLEDDKTRTSADYGKTSEPVPLEPGNHHFTLETQDGHLPLLEVDLAPKEGEMTTIFVAEEQGTGLPYAFTSTVELR